MVNDQTETEQAVDQRKEEPKGQSPSRKIVVVGGVAGGASFAARARRLDETAEIALIERGPDVSFANCGLPYYIGGEITDRSRLAVQTPESLEAMLALKVMTRTEAVGIDRQKKTVKIRRVDTGEEEELPYDNLILAPGAAPIRPPMPGIEHDRIFTLRNLQDMDRINQAADTAENVLIIGAGFIGLEMAEQLVRRNKQVTVAELQPQILPVLDADMTRAAEQELRDNGVELILNDGIKEFKEAQGGGIEAVLNSGKDLRTDMVILSIGVKPESGLAKDAGLDLGPRGHIVVNEFQQTSDPAIYAVGDVVEVVEPVFQEKTAVPLGGPANRQGRLAADHIFAPDRARPYKGSLGTAIVRVFDLAIGTTGWSEKRLKQNEIAYKTTTVTAFDHAGYFPGATFLTVKILWSPVTNRLLGAQAYGADGVDKRLDILATAILGEMSIDDVAELELSYAPPFGSAKDVVNVAGFAACNARDGLYEVAHELPENGEFQLIDSRPATMAEIHPLPNSVNIPLPELRDRLGELDREKPVLTACALGKTSYFAARILSQHGFNVKSLGGGLTIHGKKDDSNGGNTPNKPDGGAPTGSTQTKENSQMTTTETTQPTGKEHKLDCTGLACPGPIMKIKEALADMQPGDTLEVRASDPGFVTDLPAFCNANELECLGTEKSGGIITGRVVKPGGPRHTAQSANPAQPASPPRNGATLVVFSNDLDKVMASFVIANGAAAMGGQVTMFFTFWGLNALRKEQVENLPDKTVMDKMFGWMMPRGAKRLKLSQMHMMGMGTRMMVDRMKQKSLPNLPGLMEDAQKAGVRLVACSMSMEAMGIRQEELLDGVEIGGVADFLGAASQTPANLFI